MRTRRLKAIADAYLVTTKPTPVPTRRIEPAVDQAGLDRAMKEIGQPAIGAPVALRAGDKNYELPISAYAPALSVRVSGGAMKLFLDAEALAKPLTDSATGIGQKAVNARIDIVDGKPKIYPGKPGVSLRPEEMARTLPPVLTKSGRERSVTISTKSSYPNSRRRRRRSSTSRRRWGSSRRSSRTRSTETSTKVVLPS